MSGKRAGQRKNEWNPPRIQRVTTTLAELCDLVQERFPPGDDHAVAHLVCRMFAAGQARFLDSRLAAEMWPVLDVGGDFRPVIRKRAA